MISADILLKGLGGLAVVGGATTVGVCYQQEKWIFAKKKVETLEESAKKVGLSCTKGQTPTATTGVECTIKDGELSVKQGTNKETGKKKGDATAGTTAGKIKGYKDGNGFKFVIEEGDITLKEGTPTNITKLEQFETYGVEEDGGKHYLNRKTEAKDGIKKALGLDQIEGCDLPKPDGCPVDGEKFKKIKFSDGDQGRTEGPTNAKLKITAETDKTEYPLGYKFVLDSEQEAKISGTVIIKGKTNTEFKIKRAAGTNNISLEKAWTVKSLGDKVGLTCPETVASGAASECSLNDTKINVKNGTEESKKFSGLSKKTDAGDKKVKVEIEQEGYNQGFKFYVEDAAGIALQNGAEDSGSDENKKIEAKGSDTNNQVTYEILKDTDNKWYLTKKTKTQGGT